MELQGFSASGAKSRGQAWVMAASGEGPSKKGKGQVR